MAAACDSIASPAGYRERERERGREGERERGRQSVCWENRLIFIWVVAVAAAPLVVVGVVVVVVVVVLSVRIRPRSFPSPLQRTRHRARTEAVGRIARHPVNKQIRWSRCVRTREKKREPNEYKTRLRSRCRSETLSLPTHPAHTRGKQTPPMLPTWCGFVWRRGGTTSSFRSNEDKSITRLNAAR